jgi:hypothetical protein
MSKGKVTLVAAFALALFMGLGGYRWILFHTLFWRIGRQEDALTSAAQARDACHDLAVLCLTCRAHPEWFKDEPPYAPAWTPASILRLRPTWVNVDPDSARVEYGGGFHHFGYTLGPDPAASPDAGGRTAWVLSFYSEDNGNHVVAQTTLGPDDGLTEAQFVDRVFDELDRRIAARHDAHISGTDDAYDAVQRCTFALKHGRVDRLRRAIRDSARRDPLDWRDNLLAYALDHAADPAGAAGRLRQWATSVKGFSAWLLAAYAFDTFGDAAAAEDAINTACRLPADEPEWLTYNVRHRGLAMCRRLYDRGKPASAVALCDALLASKDNGNYRVAEITAIRAAAATAPGTLPVLTSGELFDPFAGIDLQAVTGEVPAHPPATRPVRVRR